MIFSMAVIACLAVLAVILVLALARFGREIKELRQDQRNDQAMAMMAQWMQDTKASLDTRLSENRQVMDSRLAEVDRKLGTSLESVNQRLESNTRVLGERLDNAARVIGEVQKQLGSLAKETENLREIGRDISSLQDILKAPKIRGGMGEFLLSDLLSQIMPPQHYQLQYVFGSGEKVDAIIRLSGKLVPVDAKFPLENFRRLLEARAEDERRRYRKEFVKDVKKHIDGIATKYILPQEGTFDFALMYIPAENVYYETIIKDEDFGEEKSIAGYALERRVIPVSPNSFYAYLQAIVLGLRGLRVEERAQEIIASLAQLKGDLARFRNEFDTLGGHITNAAKKYEEADKRLTKFEDRLEGVEGRHLVSPHQVREIEP